MNNYSRIHAGRSILILAPHTDDGELGCGGTIARLVEGGADVYMVAFSLGAARREEFDAAANLLGIQNLTLYNYPNTAFETVRQDILDNMVALRRLMAPATVLIPSLHDSHQDHATVAREALRAFKERVSILAFESPRNNLSFHAQWFVLLNEEQLDKKVKAIQCYESQADKPYVDESCIRGLARVRGVQAGEEYAEAFEVIKCVL